MTWGLALLIDTVPNFDLMLSMLSVAWWGLIATSMAIHKTGWVREAGAFLKALFGLIILWSAWGAIIAIHGADADGPTMVLFSDDVDLGGGQWRLFCRTWLGTH